MKRLLKVLFVDKGWLTLGWISYLVSGGNLIAGEFLIAVLFAIHGVLCYILWAILK